jgi:DNA damage-binding protein 1
MSLLLSIVTVAYFGSPLSLSNTLHALLPYLDSQDVLVAKSRRLEVRHFRSASEEHAALPSPFPIALQVPINGRLTSLIPLQIPSSPTSFLFMTTDRFRYAVISHDPFQLRHSPYPIQTHASGSFKGEDHNILGRQAESGPLVAADHFSRCIALHLYDGLITIIPVDTNYSYRAPKEHTDNSTGNSVIGTSTTSTSRTGTPGAIATPTTADFPSQKIPGKRQVLREAFHCRIEERTVLAMEFLKTTPDALPQLVVLHQDARGAQHLTSHVINLAKRQLHLYGSQSAPASTEWLKKTSLDGGSSILIPVPLTFATGGGPAVASAAGAVDTDDNNNNNNNNGGLSSFPTKQATGGVMVLGQRQLTFCSASVTKVIPVPQALFLTYDTLPPDPNGMPRYLLGDEFGNLHMLTLLTVRDKVRALQLDTLGSCTLSTALAYLGHGLVYVGSCLGDSQLVQIHDEPITLDEEEETLELAETTYLSVVEEYTNLGPILDFDLVPTTPGTGVQGTGGADSSAQMVQSQVVIASGSSKSGSLRLVRNGIGMNEYASVEIPGIQNMWSLRKSYADKDDAYLVQSFVGETRVLGVTSVVAPDESIMQVGEHDSEEEEEEVGGTLEEVFLPGLESSASTLYVGNVQGGDCILQITDSEVRLLSLTGDVLDTWSGPITVASANEAGQIGVALRGRMVLYFCVQDGKLSKLFEKQMEREVSCVNLHPFAPSGTGLDGSISAMDVDVTEGDRTAHKSSMMAVGLWDDFTVRLLSLDSGLDELLQINLGTDEDEDNEETTGASPSRRNRNNMMARSLSLITLDFSSSNAPAGGNSSSPGVNMLFVGLGDGTLISFAVVLQNERVSVQSKKEVCLGTQRIDLIPLSTERGGTCVLATGDRPTVIYLAGVGGTSTNQFNPKLCYSNVNLAANEDEEGDDVSRPPSQQTIAVNVAAPFFSPLLFDATALGNQHYSLCVADDSRLRLGVIDDIQKLHVTTCRLGMAPRRVVHCPEGRLFAVGCIESGIKHFGLGNDESNMGNCIRFMDDTTFDDIERVDLEPFEMILSMVYTSLKMPTSGDNTESVVTADGEKTNCPVYKPYLLVGTAYAIPDEDEPTRGRILVYSCEANEEGGATSNTRAVRQVTELSCQGGVYSMSQFYEGKALCTVNSKTQILQLTKDAGVLRLQFLGIGHHGHILSLFVKSRAKRISTGDESASSDQAMSLDLPDQRIGKASSSKKPESKERLAIVGDLMRSISLVQYYAQHETLEEVARDFNPNWTTAVEMLTDDVFLGSENWSNLFCLRRNTSAASEEVRCRLDTIGEFHLGEMCNKFMCGSLVMPATTNNNSNSSRRSVRRTTSPQKKKADTPSKKAGATRIRRPIVVTGSQTLFGTVDGTLGVVLGLDGRTAAFFSTLERAMAQVVRPVGDFSHQLYRARQDERRIHPAHGFVDGDLVESFLDLDRSVMEAIAAEMNRDGGWEVDDASARARSEEKDGGVEAADSVDDAEDRPELSVDDILAMVEEMTMLH